MNYAYRHLLTYTYWFITLLFVGLLPVITQAQTITGTVFRDFNADGAYTAIPTSGTYAYGEPGVPGVIVTAYSSNSATAPVSRTTNANGTYSFNLPAAGDYRVEFTNVVAGDFDGVVSTTSTSKTNVQFVTVSAALGALSTVNLGINYPPQYCGVANPLLATSCYTNGDPLTPPSSATTNPANDPWMVAWQYDGTNLGRNNYLAKGNIGSTWGLAYQRSAKALFAAAFMKRHSGFGTGGPGQIYKIDVSNPASASANITPFVNLQTDLGIAVGTDPRSGTASSVKLPNNKFTPNYDAAAFDLVGKMSLGDIDISDDERTLWVMNLFDQKLYELPIGVPATKPTPAQVISHTLTAPSCTNGSFRAFATKFYRGKVYVGGVCTAEAANGTAANLTAYVFVHDPAGAQSNFSQVLSFPLNYNRGYAASRGTGSGAGNAVLPGAWRPWIDQWTDIPASLTVGAYTQTVCPQPVLSDIEFDINGEMIVGFFDRFGHQSGNYNYTPVTSSTAVYEAVSAGDMLRAGRKADGTYQIENNASVTNIPPNGGPSVTVSTIGNTQNPSEGPGTGEFYWQDMFGIDASPSSSNNNGGHQEVLVGGLTLLPGTGEVVSTAYDSYTAYRAAGARYFSNTTGATTFQYQVLGQDGGFNTPTSTNNALRPATFGKAASLGDLEIFCNMPPIQIGNRVWRDVDNDGVQDAGEPVLSGIAVVLKGPGLPPAGTTVVTGTNGEYYFSNASGTNAVGFVYSLTGLTSGGSYSLSFPTSASAGALSLSTKANSATGANADAIDTDVSAAGVISFTLGQAGENNFTYDAAYIACTTPTNVSATATPTLVAAGATITLNASASGITGGSTTYTWSGSGLGAPTATTATSRTVAAPATAGVYTYTVLVSNGETCTATATASITVTVPVVCSLSVSVGTPVCNTATNNYAATGTVSLSNSPAGSLTIIDNGVTVGVVSVTAGQASASFSVSGLSNASSHTVTVLSSASICGTASRTYTAPASCSVCATITVIPTTLPNAQANAQYNQTLTASGGQAPYSFSLISGSLPSNLILSSTGTISGIPLTSGITSVTVRVTDARNCNVVVPVTITVGTGPVCTLLATASAGSCQGPANTYTLTGNISASNGPNTQSLTISVGNMYTVVTLNGNGPVPYTLEGLPAIGGTQTFSIISSVGACGVTSQTFTAPTACAAMIDIDKKVSASKAKVGDVLTYTLVLANNSSIAATNIVVQDVLSGGVQFVTNSATATAGTFTSSVAGGSWSFATVPGNSTAILSYRASILNDGVVYNTASLPGDQAKVCTTIPIQVCKGSSIAIQLDAPAGYTRYQWYLTRPTGTTLVSDVTSTTANAAFANSFTATLPGEYQVVVDENVPGSCPDLSCCPIIIEEVEVPLFTALTKAPTCLANTPQANGEITLQGLGANPTSFSYQVSSGSTFNANTATTAQSVPASGPIATTLSVGTYTVRVTDQLGCFRDVTITLTSNCGCKPGLCMPVMIVKTKSVVKRR